MARRGSDNIPGTDIPWGVIVLGIALLFVTVVVIMRWDDICKVVQIIGSNT